MDNVLWRESVDTTSRISFLYGLITKDSDHLWLAHDFFPVT